MPLAHAASLSLGWTRLHADCRRLAEKLRPQGPFLGIIAVARGGLVPASILAAELNLRHVDTVCLSSYGEGVRQHMSVIKRLEGSGAGWLVVDDLADSGETVRAVRAMLPEAHYATVYAKPAGRGMVDTYVEDMEQSVWLIFPWEE